MIAAGVVLVWAVTGPMFEHLTGEELEDIRTKCEFRAKAERVGEASVKKTEKKARRSADRAVG